LSPQHETGFALNGAVSLVVACALLFATAARPTEARAQDLEILASAHTNNREQTITILVPRPVHISELRIRTGSLAITLVSAEIEFSDGSLQRTRLQEPVPAGQQSRAIPVDTKRTIARVFLEKQAGLRPGSTALQLMGKVVHP
jgi:hypothetical protein